VSVEQPAWTESDSEQFLRFSEIITPSRQEQLNLLADLVPAEPDEAFQFVEPGCGGGLMAAFLLERFPKAQYLGLDGSATMLNATRERLKPYPGRTDLREFALEDLDGWPARLPSPVRCLFSSLVVHHLPHPERRRLFAKAYDLLEPGGALLLIDVVLPATVRGQAAVGRNWDAIVREQSRALTGSLAAYESFKQEGWNCYTDPDPIDMPATVFEQLQWMAQAGFTGVDCFWQRGGHALFGGYKPA
jgi:trans-aconitate methyltransferase